MEHSQPREAQRQAHTAIAGVRCLQPGEVIEITDGVVQPRAFISPLAELGAATSMEMALTDTVQHHMIADEPVGLFLSGGVDSTAILSGLYRLGQSQVEAYTFTFPDAPLLDASLLDALEQIQSKPIRF